MNYTQLIKDYLTFNRKEQRGLLVLLLLILLLISANLVIPHLSLRRSVDFSTFSAEIDRFERGLAHFDSLERLQKERKYSGGFVGMNTFVHDTGKGYRQKTAEPFNIELNAADSFDLQRLKGIGSAFAKRIIQYRERLGGYIDKSQLLEVFGMDTTRFHKIRDNLTVNSDSVKKIDLNRVKFKELMWHPYFPFVISKALMVYRTEHKAFKSMEDLRKIPVINDSIYRKIEPYILVR